MEIPCPATPELPRIGLACRYAPPRAVATRVGRVQSKSSDDAGASHDRPGRDRAREEVTGRGRRFKRRPVLAIKTSGRCNSALACGRNGRCVVDAERVEQWAAGIRGTRRVLAEVAGVLELRQGGISEWAPMSTIARIPRLRS